MRKTIIFDNEISLNSVNLLIDEMYGLEQVDLWFCTVGGHPEYMKALISFLNNYGEENLRVFLFDTIGSAGCQILDKYIGYKNIDNLDVVVFHAIDRDTKNIRKTNRLEILERADRNSLQESLRSLKKLGLTKSELESYKKGEDVEMDRERFSKLKIKNLF